MQGYVPSIVFAFFVELQPIQGQENTIQKSYAMHGLLYIKHRAYGRHLRVPFIPLDLAKTCLGKVQALPPSLHLPLVLQSIHLSRTTGVSVACTKMTQSPGHQEVLVAMKGAHFTLLLSSASIHANISGLGPTNEPSQHDLLQFLVKVHQKDETQPTFLA